MRTRHSFFNRPGQIIHCAPAQKAAPNHCIDLGESYCGNCAHWDWIKYDPEKLLLSLVDND